MFKTIIYFFLFLFSSGILSSQNKLLIVHPDEKQLPLSFKNIENKLTKYKNEGPYHKSEIELFPDGSFVYYFLSPLRYDLTFGNYIQTDNLIELKWDSVKTMQAVKDSSIYKKVFRLKPPNPFKIIDKLYQIEFNSLEQGHISYKFSNKNTELYLSSSQFLKQGLAVDSFLKINYNLSGAKLVIKNVPPKSDLVFAKDFIWGYKVCDGWNCYVYRIAPKGTNWYQSAGIQIVQADSLIIYTVGPGYMYSYFSKDLDSKIYKLNNSGVKEAFKDNVPLQQYMIKQLEDLPNYTAINERTDCFRIIEIYKEAMKSLKK